MSEKKKENYRKKEIGESGAAPADQGGPSPLQQKAQQAAAVAHEANNECQNIGNAEDVMDCRKQGPGE